MLIGISDTQGPVGIPSMCWRFVEEVRNPVGAIPCFVLRGVQDQVPKMCPLIRPTGLDQKECPWRMYPGLINPGSLIWGCSPPVLVGIYHFWRGHPHINKPGVINPGSTLVALARQNFIGMEGAFQVPSLGSSSLQ